MLTIPPQEKGDKVGDSTINGEHGEVAHSFLLSNSSSI